MAKSRVDLERRMEAAQRLEMAREQLVALLPGGSPDHAIDVTSAAVIEVRAAAMACPQCGGQYHILDHTRPMPGVRRVDVACRHCSTPRALWFRIREREPN